MTGIFITATGTEVGKTYLTQQLLRFDAHHEQLLVASKPVISGWPENYEDIQHTDTGVILTAQGIPLTQEAITQCSPWRYRLALTPSMAAARQGKAIVEPDLILHCQQLIQAAQKAHKIHLIEGVGGVMSPITQSMTCLSWLKQLDCACLLVAGSYLGTISHTLTAMLALQSQAIPVLGLIVNETPHSTVSLEETKAVLTSMLAPLPIFTLPYGCEGDLSMLYYGAMKVTKKALSC